MTSGEARAASSDPELEEICGLPLAPAGWELADVRLEPGDRLEVRYDDEDVDGSVRVVLLPPSTTEPVLQRLDHCAVRYEGELAHRSIEHRARATDLVAEVSSRVEARLALAARETARPFPAGLAWRPEMVRRLRFDPEGVLSLVPELCTGELIGGWCVVDAYRDGDTVCLELGAEDDPERVVLTFSRAATRRARVQTAHFSIEETLLGPAAHGSEAPLGASRAASSVALLLLQLRAGELLEVEAAPAEPENLASSVSSLDPERENAGPGLADSSEPAFRREAELLGPVLAANAAFFGEAPAVRRIAGRPLEAYALSFAEAPAELEAGVPLFLEAGRALSRRRTMGDYLESLGYAVHADGRVRTVPTPESLVRLLAAQGVRGTGFNPWLYATEGWRDSLELRLELYTEGTIGLAVSPASFYRKHRALLHLRTPQRVWVEHLTAIGRAMSIQVFATHRIPQASLGALGARAGELLRECQRAQRTDALAPLVELYSNDLVRHCLEIWNALGRPEDFADAFEDVENRRRRQAVVDRRVDETRANLRKPRPLLASNERTLMPLELASGAAADALAGARRLFGALRKR